MDQQPFIKQEPQGPPEGLEASKQVPEQTGVLENTDSQFSAASEEPGDQNEQVPQGHEQVPIRKPTKHTNVVVEPRLKPIPYKLQDFSRQNKITKNYVHTNKSIRFYNNEDNPLNRRGFKYKSCRPNPTFRSSLYSTTDLPPYKVRPSYFDKSAGILFSDDMSLISNCHQGWRSIRSNIGVSEGSWYFEFNIVKGQDWETSVGGAGSTGNGNDSAGGSRSGSDNEDEETDEVVVTSGGHVRVGVGRREASLEAPIGFDGYGYAIRDIGGQKVHLSRPQNFMGEDFQTGDTIGILIKLPSLEDHRKHYQQECEKIKNRFNIHGNLHRDQIPIKYRNSLYYEQFEFTAIEKMSKLLNPFKIVGEKLLDPKESDQLALMDIPKIPDSEIVVFKNGKEIGPIFQELYSFLPINDNLQQQANSNYKCTNDGSLGYYPMISIYNNAIVELNPGPDFKLASLPEGVKPLCDRYDDHVIEQWYFDVVDEVENSFLDQLEA